MKKILYFYFLSSLTLPVYGQTGSQADLLARVTQLEKRLSSKALIDLLNQVEQLQKEVQQLRGNVDEIRHGQERMQDRQKNLYLDLDNRLLELERASGGDSKSAAGPVETDDTEIAQAPASTPSSTPASENVSPEEGAKQEESDAAKETGSTGTEEGETIYQEAFVYLNNGRYDDAIADFKRLIETYPDSNYADNSQYWLGETFYVTRDFDAARENFNKVIEQYPESNKVPDALVKLGYIEYELSSWKKARKTLKSVIEQYPESNAAKLAQDRLNRMRKEGH